MRKHLLLLLFFTILVMKRRITAANSDPNAISTIDWSSCCICEIEVELRSTDDGIETLAKQFVAYWKSILLPFESSKITL